MRTARSLATFILLAALLGATSVVVTGVAHGQGPTPRPSAPPGRGAATRPSQAYEHRGVAWDTPAVVEFVAVTRDGKSVRWDPFSADTVSELRILVGWNVAGAHLQRLELRSPDGALYRRFAAEFDADAARFGRRAQRGGRTVVETRLPVGGTWITEYSLFGAWRVDVYLDGGDTPIASASFVLNP